MYYLGHLIEKKEKIKQAQRDCDTIIKRKKEIKMPWYFIFGIFTISSLMEINFIIAIYVFLFVGFLHLLSEFNASLVAISLFFTLFFTLFFSVQILLFRKYKKLKKKEMTNNDKVRAIKNKIEKLEKDYKNSLVSLNTQVFKKMTIEKVNQLSEKEREIFFDYNDISGTPEFAEMCKHIKNNDKPILMEND